MYRFTSKSFKIISNKKNGVRMPKSIAASYKCEYDNTVNTKEGRENEKER